MEQLRVHDRRLGTMRDRRISVHIFSFCVTVLVTMAVVGFGTAMAAAAPDRPFQGTWLNGETPSQPPAGCEVFIITTQIGNASHLGRFTGNGETCGFNIRVVEDPPFNLSGGEPPFLVADFTVEQTWTAANGDTLTWLATDGVFVQSLSGGTSSSMGTMIITGGSGRFTEASGQTTVTAIGADVTFEGFIVFDASN
ncbi:MAG TPA: hypothetical protein VE569_02120 [Acidimicrobiia bacterium]|jgi:hypothetical protein|nr:hypothetical protein [Acidimicrobiia bacterium]